MILASYISLGSLRLGFEGLGGGPVFEEVGKQQEMQKEYYDEGHPHGLGLNFIISYEGELLDKIPEWMERVGCDLIEKFIHILNSSHPEVLESFARPRPEDQLREPLLLDPQMLASKRPLLAAIAP